MPQVRVASFSISVDGFGAGPEQSIEHPLGIGGEELHRWAFATRTFQRTVLRADAGEAGLDDDYIERGFRNVGAWIIGRNMFGPVRGPWADDSWRGWWGDDPPYHVPVFVLTRHRRAALAMQGGTIFHFVTDGIHAALERAVDAAQGGDVRIGGGCDTIRRYLRARLVDEMHIAIAPALLGSGERLFEGIDLRALGYAVTKHEASTNASHILIARR